MTEHFLKSRGIAYRANEFVRGRPTLVFVHGLSGSLRAWQPYESAFKKDCNVVTFDLRGHGLSLRYTSYHAYEVREFVEDMNALFDELKIKKAILVSHSFGTVVALAFTLAHPKRVSKALFISPVYGIGRLFLVRLTQYLLGLYVRIPDIFFIRKVRRQRHDYVYSGREGDWSLSRIIPDIRTTGSRYYLYCLKQLYSAAYDNRWSDLSVPVHILHGDRDTLVPVSHAEALAKQLPKAHFTVLKGANHVIVLNNVRDVVHAIRAVY